MTRMDRWSTRIFHGLKWSEVFEIWEREYEDMPLPKATRITGHIFPTPKDTSFIVPEGYPAGNDE